MPEFAAVTKLSESIWKSPDGQREIFKVTLEVDGNPMVAKTYSKDISVIGWSGDVETYEKTGNRGSETFVKQPPKEGGFSPGSGSQSSTTAEQFTTRPTGKPSSDNFTMYLSYAKDIAVAMIKDGKLDEAAYGEVLAAVAAGGEELYSHRPDAPQKEKEEVVEVTGNEDLLADINKAFPDA